MSNQSGFFQIAPYALWMVLMSTLPATAANYAIRGVATLGLLGLGFWQVAAFRVSVRRQWRGVGNWRAGLAVGLAVAAVWLAQAWVPGMFSGVDAAASPYAPQNCGWPLTLAKLAASALVISAAEELFFRKWLMNFAGFGWMVALFAVNHWRWDLALSSRLIFVAEGALAGIAYGWLARRRGLLSAIIAHSVTNLALGLVVIGWNRWEFW